MKKISIIGSGFSGLSSAAFLAKEGFDVTILEKNESVGGRARLFKEKGILSTWVQAGIGCQKFLKNFSMNLMLKLLIYMT